MSAKVDEASGASAVAANASTHTTAASPASSSRAPRLDTPAAGATPLRLSDSERSQSTRERIPRASSARRTMRTTCAAAAA
jgi:hypothetical protein